MQSKYVSELKKGFSISDYVPSTMTRNGDRFCAVWHYHYHYIVGRNIKKKDPAKRGIN